jgi:steroid 5-alpha reductase family enzyme
MSGQDAADRAKRASAIAIAMAVVAGVGLAIAGSQGGRTVGGVPLFAIGIALAFIVQWVAFVPAYLRQTEAFYDLTGSVTYVSVTVLAVLLAGDIDTRTALLAVVVVAWAARLGTYLVRRIRRAGRDDRFDAIKPSFVRFLAAWTIQALWISLTAGAALAAITSIRREPLEVLGIVGFVVWLAGFAVEAVADLQKSRFRADPANRGRFIATGLWAWSRHPNYAGEIVLWVGVALIALPVLGGWQLLTLVSPFFVALLLIRVSGVPMLERKADATWGGRPEYEAYKARTPVLVPRPPRGGHD